MKPAITPPREGSGALLWRAGAPSCGRARGRDRDPRAAGFAAAAGHSQRPSIDRRDGALYLNPDSAGPRRFRLPISVARLRLRAGRLDAEIAELAIARSA